jgi:hypothetical protein
MEAKTGLKYEMIRNETISFILCEMQKENDYSSAKLEDSRYQRACSKDAEPIAIDRYSWSSDLLFTVSIWGSVKDWAC